MPQTSMTSVLSQVTPTMLVNIVVFVLTAFLASYGFITYLKNGRRATLPAFVSLMIGLSIFEAGNAIIEASTKISTKLMGYNLSNAIVVPSFTYALLWFALSYVDADRRYIRLLGVLAVLHMTLVTAAVLHAPQFLYSVGGLAFQGPVTLLNVTFNQWVVLERSLKLPFLIFQLYAYLIALITAGVLAVYAFRRRTRVEMGQAMALGTGIGAPVVVNGAVFVGVVPPELNLIDVAFAITGTGFAVAVFRYRLLELSPMGREQVVDEMDSPVIIADHDNRVVDSNPAARELADLESNWHGTTISQFFDAFADEIHALQNSHVDEKEITVHQNGGTQHFNMSISPILGSKPERSGRIIVLQDVTTIKTREEEITLLQQIQSRVLRHNIRNELTVVKGYSEVLRERSDGEYAELTETIETTADRLLSVSTKARAAENLIENDQTPVDLELTGVIKDNVRSLGEMYPSAEFTVDIPRELSVKTIPAMEFAIENILENAAEHNDNESPQVKISLKSTADSVVLTVTDNGPGIPHQELDVLRAGEETPLEHGSGVGLWIIQWVINESNASISFDVEGQGTKVTVQLI